MPQVWNSARMGSIANRLWIVLAAVAFLLFALGVYDEHLDGRAFYRSRICVSLLFLGTLALLIRWLASAALRANLLVMGCALLFVETLMQAAGWLGVLPAVNTKERLPWGRVYWTAEGFENSIRNRYGWHFPEFDLSKTDRIGIIGDSFVEAVEVSRTRNTAAVLRRKLHSSRPGTEVMAFGEHGC